MRLLVFSLILILFIAGCASEDKPKKNTTVPIVTPNKTINPIPPPTTELCTESDGGEQLGTKGSVSMGGKSFLDRCVDTTSIEEYSCTDNVVRSTITSCGSGLECIDGACIAPLITGDILRCLDLDGQDFFTRGHVQTEGQVYYDICTNTDNVKEFYCQNDTVGSTIKTCPLGSKCIDGACLREAVTCVDSDSGIDEFTFGNVTLNEPTDIITVYQDGCENKDFLKEYYCEGTTVKTQKIACRIDKGEFCIRGVCQKERECKDSDGGNNTRLRGIATTSERFDLETRNRTYEDSCINSYSLKEYVCEDDEAVAKTIECSYCSNGECQ